MKSDGHYIRLSNPWLLSAAPALAYAVAYLDRLGEAQVRAIPVDWISISVTDALSRTAGVIAGIGVMIVALMLAERTYQSEGTWWQRNSLHIAVGIGYGGLIFMLRIGPLTSLIGVVVGFLASRFKWVDVARSEPSPQRDQPVVMKQREEFDVEQMTLPLVAVPMLVVALLLSTYGGGSWRASRPTEVLVHVPSNRIVLASYGDRMVFGDLAGDSDGSMTVGDVRWLVALPSEETSGLARMMPGTISWR